VKPWLAEQWCFAPTADPACVAQMEDSLAVDARPSDATHPVGCLDETSRHLVGEPREPRRVAPGVPARTDPESGRGGVVQLVVVTEPLRGWRHVTVGERRTRRECAQCITDLVDVSYPTAERIVLVLDHLNIHSTASRSAAFPPAEARRLAAKLEVHDTPKHGSWLTMAELELSVMARQCLRQRLPTQAAMHTAVTAWAARRNAAIQTIDWHVTTDDARLKLRRLYPAFDA
jgi:hypothetical protein